MVKLGIVASEFNADVTLPMLEFARRHAEFLGAEISVELMVPGVLEIPLAVKKIAQRQDVDAVVALGAVIEGGTEHDEIVMQHAARKLLDIELEVGKPVGFGISGPKMTRIQALERVNDYARRAVEAVVKMVRKLEKV